MKTLRVVLGDQLTRDSAAFADLDPARDVILMVEVHEETSYVPHHKQKIALVLSAMRHFARALEDEGLIVDYVQLEDPQNTGSFARELLRAAQRHKCARAVVVEPGEYRVLRQLQGAAKTGGIRLEIREDGRFFCSRTRFARWAAGRGQLRMEFFYREMRRETGLLMQGEEPVGGRWNFDAENRKPLPARLEKPPSMRFQPDATTREVLDLVARLFRENFGDLETFRWGVTRAEALAALDVFITHRLPLFGDYQDAMRTGEPHLYHSVVSPYLNLGLLKAREVCDAAEGAFRRGLAPLNAVEGFIRQILGWREFMRGVLLAQHASVCPRQRLWGRAFVAGLLLDGRDENELRRRSHRRHAPQRLCPPYSTAHGDRQFRSPCGLSAAGSRGLVSRRLCGRL